MAMPPGERPGELRPPGRDDDEFPLTSLSIGMWQQRGRGGVAVSLLLRREQQAFAFLVDRTALPQAAQQGLKRVLGRLAASSPFRARAGGLVLAFELDWRQIVGVDYSNPLCLPGRLVLEARSVVRREFATMAEAAAFYALPAAAAAATHAALKLTANGTAADLAGQRLPNGASSQATGSQALPSGQDRRPEDSGASRPGSDTAPGQLRPEAGLGGASPDRRAAVGGAGSQAQPLQPPGASGCEPSCQGQAGCSEAAPAAAFPFRSVSFTFRDATLPGALQPIVQGDERLLKLYESGLPTWAIYAPQYGIYYRPWLRRLTYSLFILVSVFSLVMGFYDLWRNLPYLDKILRQVAAQLALPSAAILQWLDSHVSFRLSILCAYLFGKSELALQLLRWAGAAGACCGAVLRPVTAVLGPPLAAWAALARQSWQQLHGGLAALALAASLAVKTVFGPPFAAAADFARLLRQLLLPPLQVLCNVGWGVLLGPWAALRALAAWLAGAAAAVAATARVVSQASAAAWHGIRAGTRVVPAVASTAQTAASQVPSWYLLLPLEAVEVVKHSGVKVVRALQTLSRLCSQAGSSVARHRLTLQLRLRRAWGRQCARLARLAPAWLLRLCRWLAARREVRRRTQAPAPAGGQQASSAVPDGAAANGHAGAAATAPEGGKAAASAPAGQAGRAGLEEAVASSLRRRQLREQLCAPSSAAHGPRHTF